MHPRLAFTTNARFLRVLLHPFGSQWSDAFAVQRNGAINPLRHPMTRKAAVLRAAAPQCAFRDRQT